MAFPSLSNQSKPLPVWPVIINASLKASEMTEMLVQKGHNVRYSESTLPGTIIFPQSTVAFMVTLASQAVLEWPPKSGHFQLTLDLAERLDKFISVHQNSYLLVSAPLHGQFESKVMSAIQERYLFDSALKLIPVHNPIDCVECMLSVAMVTSKQGSASLMKFIHDAIAEELTQETVLKILAQIGLTHHECLVLHQGCGTIANVSRATKEQLMDCSLDAKTADKIINFFQKDTFED